MLLNTSHKLELGGQACILMGYRLINFCRIVSPQAIVTEDSINVTYNFQDSATLQCAGLGGPNNTYQWNADGRNLSEDTYQNLTLANVSAINGGIYTCVVSNLAGNDSDSTFVFVNPYFVFHPVDVRTSSGSAVVLVCGAEAFPNPEYMWLRDDGSTIRNDFQSRNLNISSIEYGDEGGYYCNASAREVEVMSQVAVITGS